MLERLGKYLYCYFFLYELFTVHGIIMNCVCVFFFFPPSNLLVSLGELGVGYDLIAPPLLLLAFQSFRKSKTTTSPAALAVAMDLVVGEIHDPHLKLCSATAVMTLPAVMYIVSSALLDLRWESIWWNVNQTYFLTAAASFRLNN